MPLPDILEIKPLARPPNCTITVLGSKIIMNRALILPLLGLKLPGVRIKNPGCVSKTFPNLAEKLEQLRRQSIHWRASLRRGREVGCIINDGGRDGARPSMA